MVAFFNEEISDMGVESQENKGQALMFLAKIGGISLHFDKNHKDTFIDQETKSTWNLYGEAISGPLRGQKLVMLISYPHFKKPWFDFYPNSLYIS